ncbi:MAG: hypothetical protein DRJ14_08940 [Acidobacteria bacterium]|nr:MAG: hypothetical protein DRJ14_08940 [Acidobacteriota bacterium]
MSLFKPGAVVFQSFVYNETVFYGGWVVGKECETRAFIVSRMIRRYPVLADRIRRQMKRLLWKQFNISKDFLESEAKRKAREDQGMEGLIDPIAQESSERWETRVREHLNQLTDYYFACNFSLSKMIEIVDDIKFLNLKLQEMMDMEDSPFELQEKIEQLKTGEGGESHQDDAELEKLRVDMTRNFISERLDFIGIAKKFFTFNDLQEIKARIIGTGKVGGKAAGMLLAYVMLKRAREKDETVPEVSIPACYYLGSDVFYQFFEENECPFFQVQKYKPVEQVEKEYEALKKKIQQYRFPLGVTMKLSNLLNKFRGMPMVVRSSSLLEDNMQSSFAGKYESIFVANNRNPEENLKEMLSAIKTVYASVFSPDVITYRKEKNLVDYDEKMAVLIQNVVGSHRDGMFAPFIAGVGFSLNMFKWSPRIGEKDGLLRVVLGLGTRAVERIGNDYARIVPLTDATLRPEKSPAELSRYSQKQVDMLNLENRTVEAVPVSMAEKYFRRDEISMAMSLMKDGYLTDSWFSRTPENRAIVTLNGVLKGTFPDEYKRILQILRDGYGIHVDTEFAVDFDNKSGKMKIFLLQCRPLAQGTRAAPVSLPNPGKQEDVLFKATGITPCGVAGGLRYIVWIDPSQYRSIEEEHLRRAVGKVAGLLNRKLPAKSFAMFGPGRWGTCDVKLGVNVRYGDINNCAVLVELAEKESGFSSDVSYGTHFYLDLIEANIFPLSIFLDDPATEFNSGLILGANNQLIDLLPDYKEFAKMIRVVDLEKETPGQRLSIYMSLRRGRSMGVLEEL